MAAKKTGQWLQEGPGSSARARTAAGPTAYQELTRSTGTRDREAFVGRGPSRLRKSPAATVIADRKEKEHRHQHELGGESDSRPDLELDSRGDGEGEEKSQEDQR